MSDTGHQIPSLSDFTFYNVKFRSSLQRCSTKKAVPKKFAIFNRKHLVNSHVDLESKTLKLEI